MSIKAALVALGRKESVIPDLGTLSLGDSFGSLNLGKGLWKNTASGGAQVDGKTSKAYLFRARDSSLSGAFGTDHQIFVGEPQAGGGFRFFNRQWNVGQETSPQHQGVG